MQVNLRYIIRVPRPRGPEIPLDQFLGNASSVLITFWIVVGSLIFCPFACSRNSITFEDSDGEAELPRALRDTVAVSSSIDAGIVFANQSSYICVPLAQIGVMHSDDVISVKSSCECVQPLIVEYLEAPAKVGRALRVDFIPELSHSIAPTAPAKLAVEIILELDGGSKKTASIKFLHTTMVDKGTGT